MQTLEPQDKQLTRKERERLTRRNEIIDAARHVFSLRGFADATLEEIAERAEFGKGTLYNYFQNKEELFEAVIDTSYERLLEIAQEETQNESLDLQTAYLQTARKLVSLLFREAGVFLLIMRELHKPATQSTLLTKFPRFVAIMEAPLKRAVERGTIRACKTEQVAAVYVSSIMSAFRYQLLRLRACDSDIRAAELPQVSEEDIANETEEIIDVLRLTFFEGILAR